MALFALTGILSLGAGMGVGALLPVSGTKKVPQPLQLKQAPVPVPQPSLPPSLAPSSVTKPTKKLQGGGAQPIQKQNLDFDEFDRSLLKMLQAKPDTIHPSVAYDPQYYSPASVKPVKPRVHQQPRVHQPAQPAALPQPAPEVSLQGGGFPKKYTQNNLNTSWF